MNGARAKLTYRAGRWLLPLIAAALGACAEVRRATVDQDAGGLAPVDASVVSPVPSPRDAGDARVDGGRPTPFRDRDTLGTRSSDDTWGGGLVLKGGVLYWFENGGTPGLYRAPTSCSDASCIERISGVAAPAAAEGPDGIAFADLSQGQGHLEWLSFAPGANVKTLDTWTLLSLGSIAFDGADVIWSLNETIVRTTLGGTSVPVRKLAAAPYQVTTNETMIAWAERGDLREVSCTPKAQTVLLSCASWKGEFARLRGHGKSLYIGSTTALYRQRPGFLLETLAEVSNITDFAMDATHAYWTEPGDAPDYVNGRVRRVAHDDTFVEEIARDLARPVALALEGTQIYVACAGTSARSWRDGEILRVR